MVDAMPSPTAVARRPMLRWLVGSGLVGAVWGTGFAALSGNRQPTATIAGDDDWQLTLIESGRSRAVVLLGTMQDPVGDTLSRLMGSFRQRIDLVIGSADALAALPANYRGRWQVQRTLVLGGDTKSLALETGAVASPTSIALGPRLSLQMSPMVPRGWSNAAGPLDKETRWVITLRANSASIRLGAQLEDIATLGAGPAAVTIAPAGDVRAIWTIDPSTAIAVNNAHVPMDVISTADVPARNARLLVPVFADDFCRFSFVDDGIRLPYWARTVRFRDA